MSSERKFTGIFVNIIEPEIGGYDSYSSYDYVTPINIDGNYVREYTQTEVHDILRGFPNKGRHRVSFMEIADHGSIEEAMKRGMEMRLKEEEEARKRSEKAKAAREKAKVKKEAKKKEELLKLAKELKVDVSKLKL